jgi:hypothetical protein
LLIEQEWIDMTKLREREREREIYYKLHNQLCHIDNSTQAGKVLKDVLSKR